MSLHSLWHDFKRSQPGHRFQDFYNKRQKDRSSGSEWRRVLYVALGVVLSIGGVILLGMPGPGLLVVALGLAMIAGEFEVMARALDRFEVWLRKMSEQLLHWWHHLQPYQRYLSIGFAIVITLGAAGCVYKVLV